MNAKHVSIILSLIYLSLVLVSGRVSIFDLQGVVATFIVSVPAPLCAIIVYKTFKLPKHEFFELTRQDRDEILVIGCIIFLVIFLQNIYMNFFIAR